MSNVQHFRTHKHQKEKKQSKQPKEDDCIELKNELVKSAVVIDEIQDQKEASSNISQLTSLQAIHARSPQKQTCINDFFGGKKPLAKPINLFGGGDKKNDGSQTPFRGQSAVKENTPKPVKGKKPRPIKNARRECPFYKTIPGKKNFVSFLRYS